MTILSKYILFLFIRTLKSMQCAPICCAMTEHHSNPHQAFWFHRLPSNKAFHGILKFTPPLHGTLAFHDINPSYHGTPALSNFQCNGVLLHWVCDMRADERPCFMCSFHHASSHDWPVSIWAPLQPLVPHGQYLANPPSLVSI